MWCKDSPTSTVLPSKRTAPDDGGPDISKFSRLAIGTQPKRSAPSTRHPSSATATVTSSRLAETLKGRPVNLDSVSIDFSGVHNTFLDFLKTDCIISSIKLRQGKGSLPRPQELIHLRNLKKLHLYSTGLDSKELEALQYLQCLQYLKLAENADGLWDSIFHVKVGGFKSLIWLCFEASKHPPLKIDEGAMALLTSLQLLCPESHGRGVAGISHLVHLNEVILHHSTPDEIVKAWKEEAKRNINRPYVEKQQV